VSANPDDFAPLPVEGHEGMRATGAKGSITCRVNLTVGDLQLLD
jgi:hypothetical protein